MIKKLTATGPNGTFNGMVEVIFNNRSETKSVQNPSTHDDSMKLFYWHIVKANIQYPGAVEIKPIEFRDEKEVTQHCLTIEKQVSDALKNLAHRAKEGTVVDELRANGYQ